MTWDTLLWERFGAVTRITTNRPHVLNAQSRLMILELVDAIEKAAKDPDVRVVVIAGAGKHFSAGHDLGSDEELEYQKRHPRAEQAAGEYAELYSYYVDACLRWRDVPKPTIAQVQGYCIMGGLMLATSCDLIIASEDARFADRSVAWGGPHAQYFTLPWEVGPRKAKEYLFTGDFITATEGERRGLVNHVVPREALETTTMELAQRIARQDPFGLAMAKRSVNDTLDIQGHRQAVEVAFKNYMVGLAHRKERGTFGSGRAAKSKRDRFAVPEAGD